MASTLSFFLHLFGICVFLVVFRYDLSNNRCRKVTNENIYF